MEKRQKNFIKGTLIAGALISVTALSATPNASSLFDYNALGSGAEVRSEILQGDTNQFIGFEANCGEKTKKAEGKKTEGKCGEGQCGEKKAEAKTDSKKSGTKAATTATTKTTSAKKETTSETKAKEGKCGEGKCGVE